MVNGVLVPNVLLTSSAQHCDGAQCTIAKIQCKNKNKNLRMKKKTQQSSNGHFVFIRYYKQLSEFH